MLFNSPEFLLFLPIVFGLYWFVTQRNLKAQNLLLLVASYVFYGWWDWRFLGLIALSTIVDFLVGIRIEEAPDKARKKRWLWVSLAVNLGILGYFKYANFFIENWISAWQSLGVTMHASTLQVILPVGISFYTFQTLSYSIDIYRGNLKATRDPVAFGAFVSFFPQLVAGPIERATNLLPQITSPRTFTYEQGRDGMRLILWGMFKKVVVADSCAPYVDMCFDNPEAFLRLDPHPRGHPLLLPDLRGLLRILRHRHRHRQALRLRADDQLQVPLLLPRHRRVLEALAHLPLHLVPRLPLHPPRRVARLQAQGHPQRLHHLPRLRVLARGQLDLHRWGGIHALLFIPLFLRGTNRKNTSDIVAEGRWLPSPRELLQMGWTFTAVTIAWVFFRSQDLTLAIQYLFSLGFDGKPDKLKTVLILIPFVFFEFAYHRGIKSRPILTPLLQAIAIALIILCSISNGNSRFIYFQF